MTKDKMANSRIRYRKAAQKGGREIG